MQRTDGDILIRASQRLRHTWEGGHKLVWSKEEDDERYKYNLLYDFTVRWNKKTRKYELTVDRSGRFEKVEILYKSFVRIRDVDTFLFREFSWAFESRFWTYDWLWQGDAE